MPLSLSYDLHEEVFGMLEFLLEEYEGSARFGRCSGRDIAEIEDMIEEVKVAIEREKKYLGRDCDALQPTQWTTNKLYRDSKQGHSQDFCLTPVSSAHLHE